MLCHLRTLQPPRAAFHKRLNPRFEYRLLQLIIINRTDPRDAHPRIPRAPPIHGRAARGAEGVLHVVPRGDGGILTETRELFLAAYMFEMCVLDDEIGGEHAMRERR